MSIKSLPWSFYAVLVSFGIFFFSLNIYILTKLISHPLASEFWLVGVIVGGVALLYSIRMVRIHQRELVARKKAIESENNI